MFDFKSHDFKGFEDWIEVFEGGMQTDSKGNTHDGDALIEKAVSTFNPSYHEPPAVVGHPKDNAPSYAWVTGLKKQDNKLLAKFKDVVPEFEQAVKAGLYKKRSASFYADGRLRHVGFLGAAPPAVKGLKDLDFSDDEAITFEFSQEWTWRSIAGVFRNLREWFIENEGQETANRLIPEYNIEDIKAEENNAQDNNTDNYSQGGEMQPKEFLEMMKLWNKTASEQPESTKSFTEADLETAKQEAAEAAKQKAAKEFEAKELEAKKKAQDKETSDYVESKIKQQELPPFLKDMGLVSFMQSLDGHKEISFSENTKQSQVEWFKDFLEQLQTSPIFKEIATKDKAGQADFAEPADLAQYV